VPRIALDNDIVTKCAAYSLLAELTGTLGVTMAELGVLGTIRFVIKPRHLKSAADGAEVAHQNLTQFLQAVQKLEPTEEEALFAAELEEAAIRMELPFDVGESQLCAMVVKRQIELLCTGDKRAIRSIESLLQSAPGLIYLKQRILPLEAIIRRMLAAYTFPAVRLKICSSEGTDKAIEICFQCSATVGALAETQAGIDSYLGSLCKQAPTTVLTA
jgi:hypothetical protein